MAVLEKGVEGLDLIEKQTVVDHVLVVGSQFDEGTVVGNEAKAA